ncbi:hypothetical protein BC938DRAFT_482993 [Jimgerdemannia flammicorona]|uniref:CNH domain-containing protein n=1 Tax=Jimgerdemannia flammicorona TaxID=994334 RepID=A0A433QCV2_9FUNG|nr:hypothetical protein BC938DRAFT_482993 [Jimgerdemannia flammicorona]
MHGGSDRNLHAADVSIFLGLDGTPTRKVGIEWTGIPEEMGYSYPYVVAILPRHVEVRNIQTQTLVQQIELPSARLLNQGKLLYIASATQIWRLTPYSFAVQVDQLVEKNEFEEAISLLQQIEPILLENKPHATTLQEEKMRTIRDLHAHYLFQRNEFDAALALFQELDTDPIEVIQMYPPAISGRVLKPSTPSEDGLNHNYSDYASDGPDRDPDDDRNNSNPWSTIVNPWSTPATEPRRDSLTITTSTNRVPSVLSTWFNPQHDPQPTPPRELTGQVLEEAINYLIRFLTDRRGKTAKLLYQQQQQQQAAQSSGRALGAKASKEKDEREKMDRVAEVAKLVDTVLLKAYMMTNDALVGPLLRVQNSCDVEECEVLLLEKKKYKELVDLYNGKGLHRKSLELLSKLGQSNEGPLRGCMPTIMYLQRLGQEHLDIILEYSEWVLRTAPEEGMKIFIKDAMDDQFSHARVLAHLEATSADLSIIYLEHVILELGDETTEFHNKLAGAYLDKVLQEMMEGSEGAEGEGNDFPSAISESRSRLIHFLNESLHYWPAKILARLQLDGLFEERAVLLSRIGQHEQALAIYVFRLRNYRMAEEYCNRIFRDDPDNGRRMYLILLRVYLKPSTKEPPLVDAALELLSRHGAHIDAEEVLAMLPVTTRMDGLFPFFEKYVRETNKNRNMNLVVKNLLEAERLQVGDSVICSVQEQWVYYRSRAVKITEDRMCPQCNRRIGNSDACSGSAIRVRRLSDWRSSALFVQREN